MHNRIRPGGVSRARLRAPLAERTVGVDSLGRSDRWWGSPAPLGRRGSPNALVEGASGWRDEPEPGGLALLELLPTERLVPGVCRDCRWQHAVHSKAWVFVDQPETFRSWPDKPVTTTWCQGREPSRQGLRRTPLAPLALRSEGSSSPPQRGRLPALAPAPPEDDRRVAARFGFVISQFGDRASVLGRSSRSRPAAVSFRVRDGRITSNSTGRFVLVRLH